MTPGTSPSQARRWRNVALVREPDSRRRRWLWLVLLGFAAATAPIAAYLFQQMQYVHVRYKIEELRDRKAKLEETERRLRIERATLRGLPSVEQIAADRLDLVHPRPNQVVVVQQAPPGHGGVTSRAPDAPRSAR